jgi:hypothetical protein
MILSAIYHPWKDGWRLIVTSLVYGEDAERSFHKRHSKAELIKGDE